MFSTKTAPLTGWNIHNSLLWMWPNGACKESPNLYLFSAGYTFSWPTGVRKTKSYWLLVQSNQRVIFPPAHSLITCHWPTEIPGKPPLHAHIYVRGSNVGMNENTHARTRAHTHTHTHTHTLTHTHTTNHDIPWHSENGVLSHWGSLPHWNATDWFHGGIERVLTHRAGGETQSLKKDH